MKNSEKPSGSSRINDNMMVYFTMFGLLNSDLGRVFLWMLPPCLIISTFVLSFTTSTVLSKNEVSTVDRYDGG